MRPAAEIQQPRSRGRIGTNPGDAREGACPERRVETESDRPTPRRALRRGNVDQYLARRWPGYRYRTGTVQLRRPRKPERHLADPRRKHLLWDVGKDRPI